MHILLKITKTIRRSQARKGVLEHHSGKMANFVIMIEAEELYSILQRCMGNPLPGKQAQMSMLPEGRSLEPSTGSPRLAAVLLLLYPKNNQWHTVFIKRNEYPGHHSGQVSFPGGKRDGNDKDMAGTALREAKEETGIDESEIRLAGPLSPLHIPVSGFHVHPFVGMLFNTPCFSPDSTEVQYLIETPVRNLLNPATRRVTTMVIRGNEVRVPFYQVKGETVWGATAMILAEFLSLCSQITSVL